MQIRHYTFLVSSTLMLSAFLLFSIQPLFTKMILPMLGGAPAVWITAMLFFQAFLLAGYFYANFLAKILKPNMQFIVHISLLVLFIIGLPPHIPENTIPPLTNNPAFWQLSLMVVCLGGPFMVISATAPLLQNWYRYSNQLDSNDPYFLYSASNMGSLAALLSYPFIVEPILSTKYQTYMWSAGYLGLIFMILIIYTKTKEYFSQQTSDNAPEKKSSFKFKREYAEWIFLSFIPASLLLGVTNFITTDIASVPLLWLLPMTLYLLTYIIAFSKTNFSYLKVIYPFQVFLLFIAIIFFLWTEKYTYTVLLIHILLFFVTALISHTSLVKTKPDAEHLTLFYLFISIGGVLAGTFNALIAPQIFIQPLEYPLILGIALCARYWAEREQSFSNFKNDIFHIFKKTEQSTQKKPIVFLSLFIIVLSLINVVLSTAALKLLIALLTFFLFINISKNRWLLAIPSICILITNPGFNWFDNQHVLKIERNYFGVIKVIDQNMTNVRILKHGTTFHGIQSLNPNFKTTPNAYYNKDGVFGDIFTYLDSINKDQHIGVIGLGVGTLACFKKEGRTFDFYEIDPDIIKIAEDTSLFTYLSECGSPYKIIQGDGRLMISQAADSFYDVIFIDAFSSDNIPIHLLTIEAVSLYLSKLKPDGILAFHISNRHLDIAPIISKHAEDLNLTSLGKSSFTSLFKQSDIHFSDATIQLLFTNPDSLKYFLNNDWKQEDHTHISKGWSDDFSNIFSILKFKAEPIVAQNLTQNTNSR